MTNCIFVYGSLLQAIAHPKGEQLRRGATLVGAATVPGRLYRVSWYPAIKLGPGDVVHGEVYRMCDPVATLAWLDEYEGIVPGPSGVAASDEYERVPITATMSGGGSIAVWIYVYRRPVDEGAFVASGRWVG